MAEASQAAEQAGIPQLDFSAFPNQIFWLVVFLVILFVIVRHLAIPRIETIRESRSRRIRNDLDGAERAAAEAGRLRSEIELSLAEAKAEAEAISAETRAKIRGSQDEAMEEVAGEIRRLSEASETRIRRIAESAGDSISEIATAAARDILSTLLPGGTSDGDIRQRVENRLRGDVN